MLLDSNPATEAGEAESHEGQASTSHRERDDNYWGVALSLNDKWRVVVCSEGRQWILQYKRTRDRWTSRKFLERAALVPQRVLELVGEPEFELAKAWAARIPHS